MPPAGVGSAESAAQGRSSTAVPVAGGDDCGSGVGAAGVLEDVAASLLDVGEKALKIRAGASKNRRKRSAMCEHKRECLGSPRCPAMLPTKVSGR